MSLSFTVSFGCADTDGQITSKPTLNTVVIVMIFILSARSVRYCMVKCWLSVLLATLTTISTVVAPAGTVTIICMSLQLVGVACELPLNTTDREDKMKSITITTVLSVGLL